MIEQVFNDVVAGIFKEVMPYLLTCLVALGVVPIVGAWLLGVFEKRRVT